MFPLFVLTLCVPGSRKVFCVRVFPDGSHALEATVGMAGTGVRAATLPLTPLQPLEPRHKVEGTVSRMTRRRRRRRRCTRATGGGGHCRGCCSWNIPGGRRHSFAPTSVVDLRHDNFAALARAMEHPCQVLFDRPSTAMERVALRRSASGGGGGGGGAAMPTLLCTPSPAQPSTRAR